MANLGSLFYSVFLKDMTDADFKKINDKFKNLGYDINLTPKILKEMTQDAVPKGIKITLDPIITNEALEKAAEGKVMKIAVNPLLTHLRKALKDATTASPPEIEVGVQAAKLRSIIEQTLHRHGFMINISTVDDNYTKVVQQKLNGRKYTVTIHADAKEISRSVQASLMQVQSRYFGLQVSKDILRRSIDEALMGKPFNIQIAVMPDQARRAVQNALNNARMVGKDDALAFQRLQTGELRAAQAELARLRAEQLGAASAAKTHATASVNLGGALGRNITIAGELSSAMASLYSIHAAKQFLSQVIEIGGELEHQKIALETIYGTPSKMESLYGNIKSLARQSPFGVMELTKNVKQLSAYGVAYNEVYDTAKRLADISAATSVDIQRLILAFGKTKNRTFLDGLEAKQFAYANIPIYDALSKKLTELEGKFVSVKDVMKRISKKEIGFDMVKEILWDMTDEGGKFYNMQEKLAGSVKTSWKLVRDNIELMFGDIAESWVGSGLKGVAEILQGLTREWKTLGAVIGAGAAAFGVYKIAVLAHNIVAGQSLTIAAKQHASLKMARYHANLAAQSYRTLTQAEEENYLASSGLAKIKGINVLWSKKLTATEAEALVAKKLLSREDVLRLVALKKVTTATAETVLITKGMTAADIAETKAQIARAAAAKRSVVVWKQIKAGLAGVVSSLWSFAKISLPLVAIGALVGWIAQYKENIKKAREATDGFTKKGRDGFEDLIKQSKELNSIDPSKLSAPQLSSRIEEMKTTLKDYSLTAEETFDKVFSATNNGKIRTQKEQFEMLRDAVNETAEAYRNMKNGKDSALFTSDAGKNAENIAQEAQNIGLKKGKKLDNLSSKSAEVEELIRLYQVYTSKGENVYVVDKKLTEQYLSEIEAASSLVEQLDILAKYKNLYYTTTPSGYINRKETGDIPKYINLLQEQKHKEEELTIAIRKKIQEVKNFKKAQNANWDPTKSAKDAEELLQMIKSWADASEKFSSSDKSLAMDLTYESIGKLSPRLREMREEVEKMVKTMQVAPDQFDLTNDMLEYVKLVERIKALPQERQSQMIAEYEKLDPAKYVLLSDDVATDSERYMNQIKESLIKSATEKYPELSDHIHKMIESDEFTATIRFKLQYGWQEQVLKEFQDLAEWQKNLYLAAIPSNEIRSELIEALGGSETVSEAAEALRKLRKEADSVIQNEGAILLKIRPTLDLSQPINPNLFNNEDPLIQQAAKTVNNAINKKIASENALNAYGLPLTDPTKGKKNKGSKGSQKDKVAEDLKQRFKDIKDAWSEFQKWSKTEGRDAAATRIADSGLFSTLPKDKIPKTVEEYRSLVSGLEDELRKAGIKGHSQRESLLNELLKQLLDIDKTVVDEQLKLALDKVSKEAERQIADWNLFDKIRRATGNQNLAMSIAFGMNATAETDYPAMVKEQLKKASDAVEDALSKVKPKEGESPYEVQGYNYEKLKELYDARSTDEGMQAWVAVPEEIRKAWEKADGDIIKYFDQQREAATNLLTEYQSLQDKLDAINTKRKIALKSVKEKNEKGKYILPKEKRKQLTEQINASADYELFKQSDRYLSFFSSIFSLARTEAESTASAIQLHLNRLLQTGKLNIDEYSKEMARVTEQINKLRYKKSDFMTVATQGKEGLIKRQIEEEQGKLYRDEKYNKAITRQLAAQAALRKENTKETRKEAEEADREVETLTSGLTKLYEKLKAIEDISDLMNYIVQQANSFKDIISSISGIASNYGVDKDSLGMGMLNATGESLAVIAQGMQQMSDAINNDDYMGAAAAAASTANKVSNLYFDAWDNDHARRIKESVAMMKSLQSAIDGVERAMEHTLGHPKFAVEFEDEAGAYGKQLQLMENQLKELEIQRAAEEDKKGTDPEAVTDYDVQINEMRDKIKWYAEETAKDLYSIDFKSWAEDLGNAIYEAWQKGEDGAEAFRKKAGELIGQVMNDMLRLSILEPLMQEASDYLFGTEAERAANNGKAGAFGSDFELTPDEISTLAEKIMKGMEGVDAYNSALDQLDKVLKEKYGLSLRETDDSKSGMTKGLQSLTEDTGDLIASYLNAVRGDTSVIRLNWDKLMETMLPQMNVIAEAQLTAQKQIAENTLRTAEAAEAILEASGIIAKSNSEINRLLARVTQGAAKFYVN